MGITGILSAIAIPQYNRYRANAARGAFSATGTNIARAFQACISVNPFANCSTTLADISVTCSDCMAPKNTAPNWCVDMESEIGGDKYTGCVGVNATTGAVERTYGTASGTNICYDDSMGMTSGSYDPDDQALDPLTTCVTVANNSAECGANNHCAMGTGGICQAAGTCQ